MDKKFWIGAAITAFISVVAVKGIAEPLGRKLQKSTNHSAAKAGSYLS